MRHKRMRNAGWVLAGCVAVLVALVPAVFSAGSALAQTETTTLRFEDPMVAMINARRWDETHHQWTAGTSEPLHFDAVHRFLLVRFPGSAEAIYGKLADGWELDSARLVLTWTGQEWRRRASDYSHRGYGLPEDEPARWHARVWVLQKPWTDDPETGPTWNAYINGAGWWREGGARAGGLDRLGESPGRVRLHRAEPIGDVDVTVALESDERGRTAAERLRAFESCGLLVHKDELSNPEFGDNFLSTGNLRMTVESPTLVVTLRRGGSDPGELPPPLDMAQLAAELKAAGGDGEPSSRTPAQLEEISRRLLERPGEMPDWMQSRVREVFALVTPRHHETAKTDYAELLCGDRERYLERVDMMMRRPPGWFMGHSHMDMGIPLLAYDAILPDALRYHLKKFFLARWGPGHDRDDWRWRIALEGGMATLNHQSQFRSEALLVGELLGKQDLVEGARSGLDLLTRQMIYSEGSLQEKGDTYYLGISLSAMQAVARFSACPLYRLKASLAVEKMLFEANVTYHPGLRRRVSSVSRRANLGRFLLGQDVPEAVLHTLSRQGVLIETDDVEAHGVPTLDLHATKPERVAALAPWGADWEHHVTDDKPMPFTAVATDYVRRILPEPVYEVTHMGRHYALASRNMEGGKEYPVHAAWRRREGPVERLADRGVMFAWGYVNDTPANRIHSVERKVAMNMGSPLLQHRNKLLYVMILPPMQRYDTRWEDPYVENHFRRGLKNVYSRISIYAHGSRDEREVWINGAPVQDFPCVARHGDVITVKEGVTYLGFIPLPATDMGREHEVVIAHDHPHLSLDSYVLDWETERDLDDAEWQALRQASAGWAIELADATEYASFADFRRQMQGARLRSEWNAEEQTLHVSYQSGDDALELGVFPALQHHAGFGRLPPSALMPYQRVNGEWPWPHRDVDLDSPVGQMGRGARLEKAGAVLETAQGQMALLRVEPNSGTYVGINPFIDPQPFALTTPEGVVVRSEGPLGLARVTVRPGENTLWVDYQLPPPEGDRGAELLQERLPGFFRPGVDIRKAREESARTLLVTGMDTEPAVVLNGREWPGPFTRVSRDGVSHFRMTVAE